MWKKSAIILLGLSLGIGSIACAQEMLVSEEIQTAQEDIIIDTEESGTEVSGLLTEDAELVIEGMEELLVEPEPEAEETEAGTEAVSEPETEYETRHDTEADTEAETSCSELPEIEVIAESELAAEEVLALAASDSAVLEGTCGKSGSSVNWKIENLTLTISGSGEMEDYDWTEEPPWREYTFDIEEVIVEKGVTSIGDYAFAFFSNLNKVTLPSTVKYIGSYAFYWCDGLTSLSLNSGLESMGDYVFYNSSVKSLTLPKTLKTVGSNIWAGMWKLENIYVASGNSAYKSVDGILYSKNGKTLVRYPLGREGACAVPSGTETIGNGAFLWSAVSSVTFPETVTSIEYGAFMYCDQLTKAVFPDSLTTIGDSAFYGCESLASVTFGSSLASIEDDAFGECSKLTKVTLPAGICYISSSVFLKSTKLTFKNKSIVKMEDGDYVEGYKVKVKAPEFYSYAFEILDLINKERAAAGADPLVMDQSLLDSAMQRAHEIVLYYSHTRPSGLNCFSANGLMWGENIAYGFLTPSDVMDAWMNSPGHRANILNANFTTVGVGCVQVNGIYSWVQCFGNELSSTAVSSSYSDQTKSRTVVVAKNDAYGTVSMKVGKSSLEVGGTTNIKVYWNGEQIKYLGPVIESTNTDVITVSGSRITAVGAGTAKVKLYFKGYEEKAITKTITVTAKQVKVSFNANGGSVSKSSQTVSYTGKYGTLPSPTRKGYTFLGWYTAKTGGSRVISSTKVSRSTAHTLYARWKKISIGQASITSLKNSASGKLKVTIGEMSGITGYQIVYATNKSFTHNKKSVSITVGTTKTLKNLTVGKTYYVKVRAYKIDSAGKRIYGAYSTISKKKVAK